MQQPVAQLLGVRPHEFHCACLGAWTESQPDPVDPRLLRLRQTVLDSVVSEHSKRNYAKALDDLFVFAAGRPLTRPC